MIFEVVRILHGVRVVKFHRSFQHFKCFKIVAGKFAENVCGLYNKCEILRRCEIYLFN